MKDLAIIGGGPAGISAGIQAHRMGLDLSVFEPEEPGGQLNTARFIENYPGFPEGITGEELARRMKEQFLRAGLSFQKERIKDVSMSENAFTLTSDVGDHLFKAVIIATGSKPLEFPVADERTEKHLHYDIIGDYDYSGKRVLLVGGGDVAFDRGINLADKNGSVTLAARSTPKAMGILQVLAREKGVKTLENAEVVGLEREGVVFAVEFSDGRTMETDVVMPCLGKMAVPSFAWENRKIDLDELLKVSQQDNGLFLAGDIIAGRCRHVGWAVGSGIKAAVEARKHLKEDRYGTR